MSMLNVDCCSRRVALPSNERESGEHLVRDAGCYFSVIRIDGKETENKHDT